MTDDRRLELAVGRVLRVGVTLSSICLGVGLVLTLSGDDRALAHLLLRVGLIALLSTPAARVIVSVVDYAIERDWVFVALTLTVLGELVASVLAAIHGRRG